MKPQRFLWPTLRINTRKTRPASFTSMTGALTATSAGKPHTLISGAATTAATPMCLDQYPKCRSAFRIGSPFEQILREAADLKAGLIVIASHCYGWFDRLVYGSDAERVLRQAPCPVLIAK